ncbi:MAG: hypothetical protein K9M75_09270 [Phycisphaerae bacterium]|nr:hypothetical protein [Phycisphaerae bacterium]
MKNKSKVLIPSFRCVVIAGFGLMALLILPNEASAASSSAGESVYNMLAKDVFESEEELLEQYPAKFNEWKFEDFKVSSDKVIKVEVENSDGVSCVFGVPGEMKAIRVTQSRIDPKNHYLKIEGVKFSFSCILNGYESYPTVINEMVDGTSDNDLEVFLRKSLMKAGLSESKAVESVNKAKKQLLSLSHEMLVREVLQSNVSELKNTKDPIKAAKLGVISIIRYLAWDASSNVRYFTVNNNKVYVFLSLFGPESSYSIIEYDESGRTFWNGGLVMHAAKSHKEGMDLLREMMQVRVDAYEEDKAIKDAQKKRLQGLIENAKEIRFFRQDRGVEEPDFIQELTDKQVKSNKYSRYYKVYYNEKKKPIVYIKFIDSEMSLFREYVYDKKGNFLEMR